MIKAMIIAYLAAKARMAIPYDEYDRDLARITTGPEWLAILANCKSMEYEKDIRVLILADLMDAEHERHNSE